MDIYQQDKHVNNVIHCLVMVAHLSPEIEQHTQDMYHNLVDVLTISQLHQLLMAENKLGLRPLEYACHLATYDLFLTIINTKDVYLIREWQEGMYIKCWYDVTDYESDSKSRRVLSPLTMLVSLDENHLSRENTGRLFRSDLMKSWFNANIQLQNHLLYLHMLVKAIHFHIFVIMETGSFQILSTSVSFSVNQNQNNSQYYDVMTIRFSCNVNITLSFILLLYSVYVLINSVYYLITMRPFCNSKRLLGHFLNKEKKKILSFNLDRITTVCSSVGCIILSIMILTNCMVGYKFNPTIIHILLLMTSVGLAWDLMLPFQLNETLGHYILIVQRAFIKIVPLAVILCNFIGSFFFPFAYLVNDLPNFLCVPAFSSIIDAVYTLIRTIFNMVDFGKFDVPDQFGLFVAHSFLFIIACIIIINIFIAILSDVVCVISQHKHIFLFISNTMLVYQNYQLFYGWNPWKKKSKVFIFHGDQIILETVSTIKESKLLTPC